MMLKKAAFFDRDGTLIHEKDYLSVLSDVEIIDPAVKIAQSVQRKGYLLFVVTNQSGIARGFFDRAFVDATHNYLGALLALRGVHIEHFYVCPHHPTEAQSEPYAHICTCRKPEPGMLLQASTEYGIDLNTSLMFGDRATDLAAGRAAGCRVFDITTLFETPEADYDTLW